MEKRILWHKWADPHAPLLEIKDETLDDAERTASLDSFLDQHGDVKSQEPEDEDDLGPAISGVFGIIPVRESNLPSKLFTFWVGHANFDLRDKSHDGRTIWADAIAEFPGVETFDVISRYRFRVAIGKAFDVAEVKAGIDAMVSPRKSATGVVESVQPDYEPQPQISESRLEVLKKYLGQRFQFWAIFVMSDGKVNVAGGNSREEVTAKEEAQQKREPAKEVMRSW